MNLNLLFNIVRFMLLNEAGAAIQAPIETRALSQSKDDVNYRDGCNQALGATNKT